MVSMYNKHLAGKALIYISMTGFINNVYAQDAGAAAPSAGYELLFMVVIFFLIMYFLVIRPQNKRNKEHKALLSSLSKGDEISTSGGILGKVTEVEDSFVHIEVQKGVELKIQKHSVSSVLPKGTLTS